MTAFVAKVAALFMAIVAFFTMILQMGTETPDPEETTRPETTTEQTEPETTGPQVGSEEWIQTEAKKIYDTLTLREKVGQLFFVPPESLQVQSGVSYISTMWNAAMNDVMEEYPAGGIILFGANVANPSQLSTLNRNIHASYSITPLIAIDEEGGRVARIGRNNSFDVPRFDSMEAVGDTGDPQNAYDAGVAIGSYLSEYGVDVDFAPVADVNTNPNNIVIGDRAFGSDPELVADMVSAAVDGFHETGIITSLKHFPGHGDTTGDTHDGYVAVTKTWDELKNCELIPFIAALDSTDMVMASHITLPNITSDGLPASLSYEMLTEKLRGELGYDGLIATDSLSMGAIVEAYTPVESAKLAFLAGADLLLMPEDYIAAFDGMVQAVENGEITQQRLETSVLRILALKLRYGVLTPAA